jgi:hypothetical protein
LQEEGTGGEGRASVMGVGWGDIKTDDVERRTRLKNLNQLRAR